MRCVVTGADGFLGANLCRELISQGHEVTGTSLNRRNGTSLDALGVRSRTEYGDVTDPAFVERVISSSEAEWVFHLAAVSIVRVAQASPAMALHTNIMGTVNVLDACERVPTVKRVLIASSDKAYGDHDGLPYKENMALKPKGVYEVSKACADHIGILYGAIVVRCANLYGEGDLNLSRMIPNSCRRALKGEAPHIYGNSINAKREWIYVGDAVSAYIKLAKDGQAGAYNVGSGDQASPMEIADALVSMTNCPPSETVRKEHDFYEIPEQLLDTLKINMLGWKPKVPLPIGLERTLDWYREYL